MILEFRDLIGRGISEIRGSGSIRSVSSLAELRIDVCSECVCSLCSTFWEEFSRKRAAGGFLIDS